MSNYDYYSYYYFISVYLTTVNAWWKLEGKLLILSYRHKQQRHQQQQQQQQHEEGLSFQAWRLCSYLAKKVVGWIKFNNKLKIRGFEKGILKPLGMDKYDYHQTTRVCSLYIHIKISLTSKYWWAAIFIQLTTIIIYLKEWQLSFQYSTA